ncbi:MAG: prepilin-type N-terminal cleavage/methylation domain-containing protein [Lentisphaeria bacterium]|nr:prepilin-type N-terminal cleavage/methylation domain-containing protein [Lentisphaeria bacterium]
MRFFRNSFTLIEVVVALAILTLSLAGLLQLLSQSQLRIAHAEEKWMEMHMLIQATEYLLLAGDPEEPTVPEEFFPYPRYAVECTVDEAEGLPDDYKEIDGQLPLKKWEIKIFRIGESNERAKVVVDRFGYEDKEQEESSK